MTIRQARELECGDNVVSKRTLVVGEVVSVREYQPILKSNTIVFVECKVGNCVMEFSHKEIDKCVL